MLTVLNPADSNDRVEVATGSNLNWYFAFFVVSGFCSLVYEVVWGRLAMAAFGVTTALVSIVISMFMAGLGLGSWGAGLLTRRVLSGKGQLALRLYALAELLVGVSSLAVPYQLKFGRQLLLHMGSFGDWQTSRYYFVVGSLIAITLIPWCTCMGSTFPLLMAVIRQTQKPHSDRSFSYLYVANVLGALLGTLVSAFVFIELLGFRRTLCIAGALNGMLALAAFLISKRTISTPSLVTAESNVAEHSRLYGLPRSTSLVFLFFMGFVSMGMEVVWIRQYTPYLGNVVYAFAEILAVYLLATFIGSRDYRKWAQSHRPNESASSWGLLGLFAILPVIAVDPLMPLHNPALNGLSLGAIVLFSAMAGFLTPSLVDFWSSGDADRAGTAYAVNIVGCIMGPLAAGFLLMPRVGERWSILIFSSPIFLIAGLIAFQKPRETTKDFTGTRPRLRFLLMLAVSILLFSVSHDFETRFAERQVRRDYTATVIATGRGFDRRLLVNGFGMTIMNPITKYISHLPLAMMSRQPQNGLVICFGMGTSFRSMLSWGIPTTTVELVPSVPALFGFYHADASILMRSPLAHIVIDDGRRFLDGSSQSYDVIVVDPPPPVEAAGSSLLYSREFYDVVKRHLRKDGIFQTWYPASGGDEATTASITKALIQSFPYVRAFHSADQHFGIHFLASMEPLPQESGSDLAARMPPAAISDFVEWGPESSPDRQFDMVLSQEIPLGDLIAPSPGIPAMQDDQPVNEYYFLRRRLHLDQ